jgi:hypothetical protein
MAVRWSIRIVVACVVVFGGLVAIEAFKPSRDWLAQYLNQVSLAITALALVVAAYAADQARRAVIQSTQFRDIDRLEDIRDEVLKLTQPKVSLSPLKEQLTSFDQEILPECYKLSDDIQNQELVTAARGELTTRLKSLREKVYR